MYALRQERQKRKDVFHVVTPEYVHRGAATEHWHDSVIYRVQGNSRSGLLMSWKVYDKIVFRCGKFYS